MEKDLEKLSFEEIVKILEQKTKEVEEGKLDLDSLVESYEKGMKLVMIENKKLDEAEKRIVALMKNENGEIIEEEME